MPSRMSPEIFDQDIVGIAIGLLQIVGELGAEMADPAWVRLEVSGIAAVSVETCS